MLILQAFVSATMSLSFPIKSIHKTQFLLPISPVKFSSIRSNKNKNEIMCSSSSPAGNIKRMVLTEEGRTKLNPFPDRDFYVYPRFVTHVDDGFIDNLTDLYRERLKSEWEIMDLMSSWVSHLPKEIQYKKVIGHGLNAQELQKNPRLDYFFTKDLNEDQKLELESSSLDAVLCTVSVQYMQQPEKVFAEVFRVLKPGGVFIATFSNRLFYEKAISAWRDNTEYGRVQLVKQYFLSVEGFTQPELIKKLGKKVEQTSPLSWIMGVAEDSTSDPFYAVISYKNFKPIFDD